VEWKEIWAHFEFCRTTRVGGRKERGLPPARLALLKKLHEHARADLQCTVDEATQAVRDYLAWRVEQARVDPTAKKYITKDAPLGTKGWDYYQQVREQEEGKRRAEAAEQNRKAEKDQEVTGWLAKTNLFQ